MISRTRRTLAGIATLILLTTLAYLPVFRAGYVWDDPDHVPQTSFQGTSTFLRWIWFKPGATPQYYPLTHTFFWIESQIWGTNPLGYHTVNVVLQIASSLLLWVVLRRLRISGAWLVAAVFAIHPINVESVAWVTEQKNTLSGFFYFLAMLLALSSWRIEAKSLERVDGVNWVAYGLCLSCFIAAVLCKTVTSTLPAALGLIIYWKLGRFTRRDIAMLIPFFAVAIGVALLTSGMEQWNVGAYGPEFKLSLLQRVLIAGRAICFYAAKLFWPASLAFIYPRWTVDPTRLWQWIFPAIVLLTVAILLLLRGKIGRGPLCATLFFIGTLFPALGFINVYPMRFSFVADHFQYLAGIGLLIIAVHLFCTTRMPQAVLCGTAGLVLAMLAILTFRQALAYKDEPTLWLDTLTKNPMCWLAMDNLGVDAVTRGDPAAALAWYDRSLGAYPDQPEAHLLRGDLFASDGKPDDAEREYAAAMAVVPSDTRTIVRASHASAKLLLASGKFDDAAKKYAEVLTLEPRLEPARIEYAMLLRRLNHPDKAIEQYQKAIELNPDSVAARGGLAELLFIAGDLKDAIPMMAQAIDIEADPRLRNNYGVMLMKAGRVNEAAEQFSIAIADRPDFADAYDGLGNAFEAQGRLADAIAMYLKAIKLNPDLKAARDHLAHAQTLRR